MSEQDEMERERAERGRRLAAQLVEGGEVKEVGVDPTLRLPRESRGFAEGAAAERHLRENVCPNGVTPWGPYVPPARRCVSLEEKAELVEFLPHYIGLFRILTPDRAAALGRFAVRLAERQTVGKWWRWAWKLAVAVVMAVFASARWGLDQAGLIRDILNSFRGHGP